MKRIVLLLCILSIAVGAKAQLFGKNWKEGSYYDLKGIKHTGFIAWTPPQLSFLKGIGDKIHYKNTKKDNDVEIKSTDLSAFTMKIDDETIDSFIVSTNKMFEKAPFLKVVIANDLKLYGWTTMPQSSGGSMGIGGGFTAGFSASGGKTAYFYGNDPENLTKLDKKNFIETTSQIMANKPEAVARIKNKKLRYSDMNDLLYFYKYDVMPPAQAPDPFSGSNNY